VGNIWSVKAGFRRRAAGLKYFLSFHYPMSTLLRIIISHLH
jgi:hypothetical protein